MKASIVPFTIGRDTTLKAVMERLEETEERILFVLDDQEKLFGSVTDGDIRRWILAGGGLDRAVEDVCNRYPYTVPAGYQPQAVRRVMLERNIVCVPVLDGGRRIIDLLFWDQVFQDPGDRPRRRRQVKVPVVIMAGGKGTRLDPFTRILPKPLIPVGDKTVIELIIESFTDHGVMDFCISVNHKANLIKSFFEELAPAYRLRYLKEDQPLGTAGGLRVLAGQLEGNLIVTNCDIIVRADYADLVAAHEREGNDITIVASLKAYNIPYGVCELNPEGRLGRIVEKPHYDLLVNTGMYVLHSDTLGLIPPQRMFHATDLIDAVLARGGKVGVYPIGDQAWLDTGEWAEYRRTVQMLSHCTGTPPAASRSAPAGSRQGQGETETGATRHDLLQVPR